MRINVLRNNHYLGVAVVLCATPECLGTTREEARRIAEQQSKALCKMGIEAEIVDDGRYWDGWSGPQILFFQRGVYDTANWKPILPREMPEELIQTMGQIRDTVKTM